MSLVRASCHSTQSYSGSPVRLSHTTVDSRWLVMPTPTTSFAVAPAFCSAPAALSSVVATIRIGSICDQPGFGVVVADCSSHWCEATVSSVAAS